MKIAQLIAILSNLPADARVFVDGYECGYDEVCDFELVQLVESTSTQVGAGDFEAVPPDVDAGFAAVYLRTTLRA